MKQPTITQMCKYMKKFWESISYGVGVTEDNALFEDSNATSNTAAVTMNFSL